MATPYTDIISHVRAAIGDFGVRDAAGSIVQYSHDYHNDDISSVITFALLKFSDYSGNGINITPTLATNNDIGALACYVAVLLVLPGGTFSMETPNMRYWVQANQELIAHLLGLMEHFLDAGDVRPSIWGALDQLYNEGALLSARITEAVGAY